MAENEILTVDPGRFEAVCRAVLTGEHQRFNIGTYREKTQHLILKQYFEPDPACQEVPYRGFIADIRNEQGIMEIQTSGFGAMRKKLEAFLKDTPVTVLYPVPHIKWVAWISPEGEISEKRRSPKRFSAAELLPNLIYLRPLLGEKNLHFAAVLLEVEEYRNLDGWGGDGKRGSSRYDRIPVRLIDIVPVGSPADYARLLPFAEEELFSTADLHAATKLSAKKASTAMNVLKTTGAILPDHKDGRRMLYRLRRPDEWPSD